MWAQGGQVLDRSRTWSSPRPAGIPDWNPNYVEAGDPRWRGTREQEKRRQLAKKFYVAFRRREDDETRYARLAKRLSMKYREEEVSAGLLSSNGQSNRWVDLVEEGLISAEDACRQWWKLRRWFEEDEVSEEEQRRIEIQI